MQKIAWLLFTTGLCVACSFNNYKLKNFKGGDEPRLDPPARVFARQVRYNESGTIKRNKHLNAVNIRKLNGISSGKGATSSHKQKWKVTQRIETSWLRQNAKKTTPESNGQDITTLLFLHIKFDGKNYVHVNTLWNFNQLHKINNAFDYEKFLTLTDILRYAIDELEKISWTRSADDNQNLINKVDILNKAQAAGWIKIKVDSEIDGTRFAPVNGQHQIIMNAFYDNLPLPNSLTLYSYGYLNQHALSETGRSRYFYYLDQGFGLNTYYTPATTTENDSCKVETFATAGFAGHFLLSRTNNNQLSVNSTPNRPRQTSIDCYSRMQAGNPFDFSSMQSKYIMVSSGANFKLLRNASIADNSVENDIHLIAINSLQEAEKILFKMDEWSSGLRKNWRDLANANKIYVFRQNQSDFQERLAYFPTFNTFWINKPQKFTHQIQMGTALKHLQGQNHSVKRQRVSRKSKYAGIRLNKTQYFNELLLKPNDKITHD